MSAYVLYMIFITQIEIICRAT